MVTMMLELSSSYDLKLLADLLSEQKLRERVLNAVFNTSEEDLTTDVPVKSEKENK